MSTQRQISKLMAKSRSLFIKDLRQKIEKITKAIDNYPMSSFASNEYITGELQRLFHSVQGTAATLNMADLATRGREYEDQLRNLMAYGPGVSAAELRTMLTGLADLVLDWQLNEAGLNMETELAQIEPDIYRNLPAESPPNHSLSTNDVTPASKPTPPSLPAPYYTNLPEAGKILLIDDDVSILNLLEGSFSAEGYSVYICDNPQAAMDMIAACQPDAILLDIVMPQVDGYAILAQIRAVPAYAELCVIFITAMNDLDAKIKGMESGVDDYVTKPFQIREVVSRVEMVLRRANKYKEKLLRDAMTGAYSRAYMNERLRDELERYRRNGTVFSLAFVDLDFFKNINDTYGHTAGDSVLQSFVSFVLDALREADCIFRYGGEEFVILLPDSNEAAAFAALDRLRQDFSRQVIVAAGQAITVTFSAGIKQVDDLDQNLNHVLAMCDEAMYAAKSAGRNKVICYSAVSQETVRRKTILVVDDEKALLKLLSNRLTEAGYQVLVAARGREAVELVQNNYVDAVILDLILPDLNGIEICQQIKDLSLMPNVRVIILSQKRQEQDVVLGLRCGADDYVRKPFSMAELEARIMRVLSR